MAEDGLDFEAASALHVHEKAIRSLHKSLLFVSRFLGSERWVEEIDGERHFFFFLI